MATLPDLSSMESVTYVNEVDIQNVRQGQPVQVALDADPEKQLAGTVSHVANVGEQRPGSSAKFFEVVVSISAQDTTLRPGMTTSNTIVVARRQDVLNVPLEAVHAQGDSLSYVFVKHGGAPVRQQVALGLIGEDRAVVQRGLEREDDLYLSVPSDTSGLAWNLLEDGAAEEEKVAAKEKASSAEKSSAEKKTGTKGEWKKEKAAGKDSLKKKALQEIKEVQQDTGAVGGGAESESAPEE